MEQIFDLGPGFGAVALNMPEIAKNRKIELFQQFLSQEAHLLG